jgi:hypothetical protein
VAAPGAVQARIYADLLGKPWRRGARGPEAYDCLGLALEIARRLGRTFPAYVSTEAELHAQLGSGGGTLADCPRIAAPEPGAVALLRMSVGEHHLAFLVDRYRMIHTTEATGCVVERILEPMWQRRIMGYFRLEGSSLVVADATALEPTPAPPVLHLVHVHNPLMPSTSREARELVWVHCRTVREYLDEAFPLGHNLLLVSLNGRMLAEVEQAHVLPRAGDYLVVSPSIEGGGVFRTLAMVAVMAASIAATHFLGPAGFGLMSGVWASVVGGAVSIGGNLLINTFMGLTPATKSNQPSWAFGGPTTLASPGVVIPKGYGTFRSAGNIIASFIDLEGADQYINALVCYGFGPARSISDIQINSKSISSYTNVQYYLRYGTNDQTAVPAFNRVVNGYPQSTQVLVSSGPVVVPGTGDLTQALQVDIEMPVGCFYISGAGNQLPLKLIYKVEYAVHGTSDWQNVMQPDSTSDVVVYNSDGSVNWDSTPTWVLKWTGGDPASGIVLKGDSGSHTAGDTETITETVTTTNPDTSTSSVSMSFTGEWQPIDITLNQVKVNSWRAGWVVYEDDTTSTVYNRTSIYGLAANKYDVRVTKYGNEHGDGTQLHNYDEDSSRKGQQIWIHSVNEITYQDLSYPNMILVGIRALATNQLSGSSINITALIEYGLRTLDNNLLPESLQAFEEDNPVCVAADMMLDPLYGGGSWPGIKPVNIERFIDEWLAWAELNDTLVPDGNGNNIRLHVFNGVFDNEDNLWNQLQTVGRMSRACIVPMGLDYGVFVNQDDDPVQMFSVGSIVIDSFEETFMDLDERANQVEIEFADSTRYYKTNNPLVYMDPADQEAGAIVKNVRVRGTGITVPAQAWHYGHFLGLSNKKLLRTGKFDTDIEGIACRPGNVVILQHDVPEWGWGGRTLPESTATVLNVDRNDLPWDGTTAYNVIVLFPDLERYTGTVTAVATLTDSTGLSIGTQLTLSTFDAANRVTRALVAGNDCAILSSAAGSVTVTLPPGFTPTVGMAYALYDTDVLETSTVSGVVAGPNNTMQLTLGTGFTAAPADFSVYFYGQPGAQKLARVTSIRKKNDFKATIEWIDKDSGIYAIGTPVVGETSASTSTVPGVSNLKISEIFQIVSGSYMDYAVLTWTNGTNTAGVAIYGTIGSGSPTLLVRQTGTATTWKYPVKAGVTMKFTVVGFDSSDNYAAFSSAPSVSFTGEGITDNLLLGSTFQTGFTYWNVNPRSGDSLAANINGWNSNCTYTVAGSALTTAQTLLSQVISTSDWAVGDSLILSAYFSVAGTPTGNLVADIAFQDASGSLLSTSRAVLTLAGAVVGLSRAATAVTAIPISTAQVTVRILVDGSTLSLPVGTAITVQDVLLEIPSSGQTSPSTWADADASSTATSISSGSSSSLRAQSSVLPTISGNLAYSLTSTTATLSWSDLAIGWSDGSVTYVPDGSLEEVTGLTASTEYYAYPFWDVLNATMGLVSPSTAVGTPAVLSTSYDEVADLACKVDNRVAIHSGGFTFTTPATSSGSGSGSGTTTGGGGGYRCTLRGTPLLGEFGPVSNEVVKAVFDANGEYVLRTPFGAMEPIKSAQWVEVDHYYRIEVEGFAAFCASGSHTLFVEGESRQRWCSTIPNGSKVATARGYRVAIITRIERRGEVLAIELEGPTHQYVVLDGVYTHNMKMDPASLDVALE